MRGIGRDFREIVRCFECLGKGCLGFCRVPVGVVVVMELLNDFVEIVQFCRIFQRMNLSHEDSCSLAIRTVAPVEESIPFMSYKHVKSTSQKRLESERTFQTDDDI